MATDTEQKQQDGTGAPEGGEKVEAPAADGGGNGGQVTAATPPPSPTPVPGSEETLSGQPLKDVGDGTGPGPMEVGGAPAVQKAASGQKLTDREQGAALEWLLQADPDPGEVETKVLQLNFGTSDAPQYVNWEICPVGIDEMRRIRERGRNNRQARRTGQVDEYRMNLQIVVAGTRTPNVREAARLAAERGNGSGDAVEILRARFQSKPGYIAQISAEIMSLSGFDDDDVTEKDMIDAAGNS